MQIILYETNSDKKALNKVLVEKQTLDDVNLLQDCSVINPIFRFNGLATNYPNYLYCAEFKRYYFIKDVRYLIGQIVELSCHVDVLMSFKNDILNSSCIVDKSSNGYNLLLADNIKLKQSNSVVVNKKFEGGEFLPYGISAQNRSFILTCFGGV